MVKLVDQEGASNGANRRLVLGFDAGCMTCSELAHRIEEQVGGKLEVKSLSDPQIQEWRRKSLGENAPWVPTLIEVKDLKVRAWTGKRMSIHLSRSLGPVATWRVMQVLGEMGATVERLEESPAGTLVGGMSRSQFFKGVGGAAIAMSILSGTGGFTSIAAAATKGGATKNATPAQRNKVLAIVRSSQQFKDSAAQVRQTKGEPGNGYGTSFEVNRARVLVNGNNAAVIMGSPEGRTSARATFFVDLQRRKVIFYRSTIISKGTGENYEIYSYENGKRIATVSIKDGYVSLPNGQRMTIKQFTDQYGQHSADTRGGQSTAGFHAMDDCSDCLSNEQTFCEFVAGTECLAAGLATFILGAVCTYLVIYADSQDAGCVGYARSTCLC